MESKVVQDYKKFMLESNYIEREEGLNPNDIRCCHLASMGIDHLKDVTVIHELLTKHLNVDWSGKFRTCAVRVGMYVPPNPMSVPYLMEGYMNRFPNMNAWEAHNEFQSIHPFQDFNGRVGRLIWLSKAIDEGYKFGISFLQMYYYNTLQNYKRYQG